MTLSWESLDPWCPSCWGRTVSNGLQRTGPHHLSCSEEQRRETEKANTHMALTRTLENAPHHPDARKSPLFWTHRHFFLFNNSKKFLWCETAHKPFPPDPVVMLITCGSVMNNQKELVQRNMTSSFTDKKYNRISVLALSTISVSKSFANIIQNIKMMYSFPKWVNLCLWGAQGRVQGQESGNTGLSSVLPLWL